MPSIPLLLFRAGKAPAQDAIAELRAALEQLRAILGGEHGPSPVPTGGGHVETSLAPDGRIATPEGIPPADLSDAIKRYWPRDVWTDAARVSYVESAGWNRFAARDTLAAGGGRCNVPIGYVRGVPIVSELSVGYYQINVCAHGHDRGYWEDADNNVSYGARLYESGGWGAWQITARQLGLMGE